MVVLGLLAISVACMCAESYTSFQAASARSEWIFSGRVADDFAGRAFAELAEYRWLHRVIGERHAMFEVGEIFKGKPGKRVLVRVIPLHQGCGPMLLPGKEYLVFARRDPQNGYYYTHWCDRTRLIEHASEDIGTLRR